MKVKKSPTFNPEAVFTSRLIIRVPDQPSEVFVVVKGTNKADLLANFDKALAKAEVTWREFYVHLIQQSLPHGEFAVTVSNLHDDYAKQIRTMRSTFLITPIKTN